MNTITEIVWDIITETPALLSELTRIVCQEYEPFLSKEHEEIFEVRAYSSQP